MGRQIQACFCAGSEGMGGNDGIGEEARRRGKREIEGEKGAGISTKERVA